MSVYKKKSSICCINNLILRYGISYGNFENIRYFDIRCEVLILIDFEILYIFFRIYISIF